MSHVVCVNYGLWYDTVLQKQLYGFYKWVGHGPKLLKFMNKFKFHIISFITNYFFFLVHIKGGRRVKQAYVAYAWVHPCFSKSSVRETQQLLGLIRNADSLVQPTTNEPAISVLAGPPDAYIRVIWGMLLNSAFWLRKTVARTNLVCSQSTPGNMDAAVLRDLWVLWLAMKAEQASMLSMWLSHLRCFTDVVSKCTIILE